MRAVYLAVLLAAVALGAPARAASSAQAFFQAGAQAYDAGRFEAAVQAFEEAYRQAPMPAILFSMAQAERKQFYVARQRELLDRAIAHYRTYLDSTGATRRAEAADALAELESAAARLTPVVPSAEAPPAAKARLMVTTQVAGALVTVDEQEPVVAPFIDELRPGRHLVKVAAEGYYPEQREVEVAVGAPAGLDLPLKERAGTLALDAPPGAYVYVDGKRVGEAPLGPLDLAAGRHTVALVQRGREPWSGEVVLSRGKSTALAPGLTRTWQRVGAWAVIGAGAAAALGGVACTVVALNREQVAQKVVNAQAVGNISSQQLADYALFVRQRDQWRGSAQGTFGAAAGLLVIGGLLFWLDMPAVAGEPAKDPAPLSLAPVPLPGGAGVAASGRF